ncbi:MAG: SDR family NAD(P)-dependent oxidoreductase [Candidatus Sericytochromatia bacterium]|nr:SDR family NAD(P)-dependent oxidoreductase [Candidatus Sericytochromatia bacterium]
MSTILITGTSSGFGRQAALELARRGHRVFAGMRDPATRADGAGERLAAEAAGTGLEVVALDVTEAASVEAAVAHVRATSGPVDVLVNNAGIAAGGVTEAFTEADAQRLFDVNVFGQLRLARAVLPEMRARGAGLIVNVTSTLSREVIPFLAIYQATKFALEGLWEAWRYELTGQGVEVVLVQPGTFPTTAIVQNLVPPGDPERATGYADLLPRIDTFFGGLAAYAQSGQAPDPALVGTAIAEIVAVPAGQRPVRVVVDPNGPGAASRLNALAAAEQEAILSHLGLGDLLVARQRVTGA